MDGINGLSDSDWIRLNEIVQTENLARKPLTESIMSGKKTIRTFPIKRSKKTILPSNEIPVLFTNVDQLTPSKMTELQNYIRREKSLIVTVCEVKPKNFDSRASSDYEIPEYSLHPVNHDPETNADRGIVVYTHNSIDKSVVQIKPDDKFEETCLLEIRLRGGDWLLFGCFYRSPTSTTASDQNNDKLNNLLRHMTQKNYSHICLVGDFNFPDINWDSWMSPHIEESKESKFIDTVQSCYLHQHTHLPTRRRGNDNPSLLDLLFTDEAMQISDISHHAPLGKSDHDIITFKFHSYLDFSKSKERFIYDRADFRAM